MRLRLLAAVTMAFICGSPSISAQDAEPSVERPKIGVALAGGGAKGIAHIGVLEALEELNIPIDYVAGTSMGSIVGGLYASGMSPEELKDAIERIDWADAMIDDPPRRDLSFRRKLDSQRYFLDLEVGVRRDGLAMPSGLQTGQKLTVILQWLTAHVADVRDFDELPTPFRCVAADIGSGEEVVLDGGDLAWAMRASMAIPTVFTPVELDGRTLVDGGIVNNVPVDVVRAMGADIVIAIDLGAPLDTRNVSGWFGVFRQLQRMLTRRNMDPQLADADIVLRPPGVSSYGTLDFSSVDAIYGLGLEAVAEKRAELESLGVDQGSFDAFMSKRAQPLPPELTIASITIEGNERVDTRVIENRLRMNVGDDVDFIELAHDISTVYGLGDFDRIGFRLEPHPDDTADVVIEVNEKAWGPNYMRFGLFFESDLDGDFNASGLVNLTMTRLNAKGAEWRNDLRVGRRSGLVSEFYQPLTFSNDWFFSPLFLWERRKPRLFVDGDAVAELDEKIWILNTSMGYQFNRFAESRLGVEIGGRRLTQETGTIDFPTIDATVAGFRFNTAVDSLDDEIFPSSGVVGDFDVLVARDELGSDDNYNRVYARANHFVPRGQSRVFYGLEVGLPVGGHRIPDYDLFTLGGFGSLSGFKDDELRGQYVGVGRLGYYRSMSKRLKLGGFVELGNVWQEQDDVSLDDTIFTGTVFVGLDSLVGPVIFAWGENDIGEGQLYLTLGRTF